MSTSEFAVEQAIDLLVGESGNAVVENSPSCNLYRLLRSGCEDPAVDSVLAMLGSTASSVHRSFQSVLARTLATVLSTYITSETRELFHRLENMHSSTYSTTGSVFMQDVTEHNQAADSHENVMSEIALGKLLDNVLFVLSRPDFEGPLALELIEELVKITSMFPSMKLQHAGVCLLYEREHNINILSFSEHLTRLSLEKKERFYDSFSPTTRLLLWRLQPDLLWHDLSAILQRISRRPLLPLKHEFRHTYCWRSLVLGLALGPDVFSKARTILNSWLLASGASCLFELKEELGAAVRDVLEHPVAWDITIEKGADLPPLSAFYYADLLSKVRILMMAPNSSGLMQLVNMIKEDISKHARDHSDPQPEDTAQSNHFKKALNYTETVLHNPDSLWMLLMDFPIWVQYAAFVLFLGPNSASDIDLMSHILVTQRGDDTMLSRGYNIAATYISWNFSPCDNKFRDLVARMLLEMVKSWRQIDNRQIGQMDISRVKRRKLMVILNDGKNSTGCTNHCLLRANTESSSIKDLCHAVVCWLMTFQNSRHLLDTYGPSGSHSASRFHASGPQCMDVSTSESRNYSHDSEISSFFTTFPLVALACSPELQNHSIVHVVLHFVMSEYGCWLPASPHIENSAVSGTLICKNHGGRQGADCREPSHRTEDFKDPCTAPFCVDFPLHAPFRTASAIARVLKFLETLDVMKFVMSTSLEWIDDFKEMIVMQLAACIRRWSEQVVNVDCSSMLDDLRRRASMWASKAGLKPGTLEAFNGVLQDLDVIISSFLVKSPRTDV